MVFEMKMEVCQGEEVEGVLLVGEVGVRVEVLLVRNEEVKVEVHHQQGVKAEVQQLHKGAKAEPSHKVKDLEGIIHPDLLLHQIIIVDHYHKDGVKVNDINWYPLKQPQQPLQHIMMIIQLIHDYQNVHQPINQYQHLPILLLVVIVVVKVGVKVYLLPNK